MASSVDAACTANRCQNFAREIQWLFQWLLKRISRYAPNGVFDVWGSPLINDALELPCGRQLANRICKAAMTEGLADAHDNATLAHRRLYSTWARGGAAVLLTGNIMIDRRYLERSGNVVVEDDAGLAQLRD
jgi:hypothetical protein